MGDQVVQELDNIISERKNDDTALILSGIRIKKCNSKTIGDYVYYTPSIGKGSYSEVYIGHRFDMDSNAPKYFAIKKLTSSKIKKMSVTRIKREIELLKTIDHPNIVKFYEAFTDVSKNIYIVTEYCNYGSFDRFIKDRLNEANVRIYMIQLKNGLEYLWYHNILHRDIKPPNILLHKEKDNVTVKIADFGFAKKFNNLAQDMISKTLCGTPLYLAPEIVENKKYSVVSDLWSIGIILFQLLNGHLPFRRPNNMLELSRNIREMNLIYSVSISKDVIKLVECLLQIDPDKRMSWVEFFNYDWFRDKVIERKEMTDIPLANSIIVKKPAKKIENDLLVSLEESNELGDCLLQQTAIQMVALNIIEDYIVPPATSMPSTVTYGNDFSSPKMPHISNSMSPLSLTAGNFSPPSLRFISGNKSKPINIPKRGNSKNYSLADSPVLRYISDSFSSSVNYVSGIFKK